MKLDKDFILVEEFDLKAITKAFKEGRLYIESSPNHPIISKAEGMKSILAYVSRIDKCATPPFAEHIQELWQALLNHEVLGDLFFLNRYKATRGQVNWYRVTAIIYLLLENNVYQNDTYKCIDLHLMCEGISKRNTHYTGMNRYLLNRDQMKMLKAILQQFR